jgi:hypothetical protein
MNVFLVYKFVEKPSIHEPREDVVAIFSNQLDATLYAERKNELSDDRTAYVVEQRQVHESLETANV